MSFIFLHDQTKEKREHSEGCMQTWIQNFARNIDQIITAGGLNCCIDDRTNTYDACS